MKLNLVEGKKSSNPVDLEAALGLARGKIHSVSLNDRGNVLEVDFDDSVNLPDSTLQSKLETVTGMKVK